MPHFDFLMALAAICTAVMIVITTVGWTYTRILRPTVQVIKTAALMISHVEHFPELRDRVEELEADTADIAEHVAAIAREIGADARRPGRRRELLEAMRAAARARAAGT